MLTCKNRETQLAQHPCAAKALDPINEELENRERPLLFKSVPLGENMKPLKMLQYAFAPLVVIGTVFSVTAQAGEIVTDSFKSIALGRDYKFQVYLPDGYKDKPGPYPVVYVLHGAEGDEYSWTAQGGVKETLDALIKRGHVRPSIAVMPGNGRNWYVDGAVEKAETALVSDLIPYVEGKYKASRDRGMRAVGGFSMGGYGALNLALKYPDKFCAAALLSPTSYDPLPPETSSSRRAPQFLRDGKFDPDLWKSLNYPAHLDAYSKAPRKVPLWIVSGDHDFLGIALVSAQLYWRLYQIQPKQVELRVVDGDHEWMVWRDTLPDALRYMDEQCARGG